MKQKTSLSIWYFKISVKSKIYLKAIAEVFEAYQGLDVPHAPYKEKAFDVVPGTRAQLLTWNDSAQQFLWPIDRPDATPIVVLYKARRKLSTVFYGLKSQPTVY